MKIDSLRVQVGRATCEACSGNLEVSETIPAFALVHRETKKNLCRDILGFKIINSILGKVLYFYFIFLLHILELIAHNQTTLSTKNIKTTNKIHFNILRYSIFIIISPTCFGHLQGDVRITRIQMWLTVSPQLHNN